VRGGRRREIAGWDHAARSARTHDPTAPLTPPVRTAVVVHWNQAERALSTVAALAAQDPPLEALVVDNGSNPEHLGLLRDAGLPLIELGHNCGFGPAANAGLRWWLRERDDEWVAVVPHDAEPAPDTMRRLLDALEAERRVGLVSADVGDQARPIVDPYLGALPGRALGHTGWEPADFPHGTMLLARRACLVDIGLFDEVFFAYGEEADLGLRARRLGWQVGIVRGAMVTNPTMSSATAVVDYLKQRNTLLLLRRHFGRWPATMRAIMGGMQLLRGLAFPRSRPPWFSVQARRRALWDGLRGRGGPPPPGLW